MARTVSRRGTAVPRMADHQQQQQRGARGGADLQWRGRRTAGGGADGGAGRQRCVTEADSGSSNAT
ncbi:hypothetical protein Scep_006584 [Stephania cephalantha]|uniref:Uncharacterized protein n=1 Tax=Stephania cephalantha TaxID=152367 RepID=A0AAP0KAS3_9MAGN